MIIISKYHLCAHIIPYSWDEFSIFSITVFLRLRIIGDEEIGSRIGEIIERIVVVYRFWGISDITSERIGISIDIPYSVFPSCENDRAAIGSESRIHIAFEPTEIPLISRKETPFFFSHRFTKVCIGSASIFFEKYFSYILESS